VLKGVRNPAHIARNPEEAAWRPARQHPRMNYNNVSCRLIVPRVSVAIPSAIPRKSPPKKARKVERPRLLAVVSAVTLMLGSMAGTAFSAETTDHPPGRLCLVPALDTVAFGGFTGRLTFDASVEEESEENDLTARLDALTAQVHALTAKSMQSVGTENSRRLSTLTGVLLCAGLGVAIFRAGSLLRTDLFC
jgi:hypothetical protein